MSGHATETLDLRSPSIARERVKGLVRLRDDRIKRSQELAKDFERVNSFLDVSADVTAALKTLNEELFEKLLAMVQEKLTIALQEILEQPVKLRADSTPKRNNANVEFYIDREGHKEDIMRGQGGSVANILSVGLRMFALMTLDESEHRRFLVLDEQDCWLRPDLVPRLVKMVQEAGQALGFQVLMISHHEPDLFEKYADKIYRFELDDRGTIQAQEVVKSPSNPDAST